MAIAEVKALYEEYIAEAAKVESEHKPTDGLFGMGKKTADDPCHDRFTEKLEAMLKEFAESKPASAEVCEVLEYIYRMSYEHGEPLCVYWQLNAVHGLTLELVGMLDKQDAEKLYVQYRKMLPRWKRLPVQKKVFSELDKIRK
jgi:hypothetical protein